jgi:thioredoxin-related protein
MLRFFDSVIVVLIFLTGPQFSFCQSPINPDQAFLSAQQSNKHVLLIFSGSDWCQPCDRFNKTILSDSSFQYFAAHNLILINADFPQRIKLNADQIACNEKLAEAFNPDGIFPYLLLLNPDRSIITILDYLHYDPAHFIEEIKNALVKSGK